MKRCILNDVELTQENDSKAHIIPSALGGRLKPMGILCKDANTELGDKFDNALIQAYHPFMVLVDGTRDRSGDLAPIIGKDKDGRPYKITPDEVKPNSHEFIEEPLSGSNKRYVIKGRTMKEVRTLLGRVKKEHPQIDIDQILKSAAVESFPVPSLELSMQFGPISTFPAVFVMASVFSAYNGLQPHPEFVSYVKTFDVDARQMPPDTFYFMPGKPWLVVPADAAHCIFLCCDPVRKQSLFFAQFFKQPGIAVVLPYDGVTQECFSYAVDVVSGREIKPEMKMRRLLKMPWKATHKNGDPALWKEVERRTQPLLAIAQQRDWDTAFEQLWKRHVTGPVVTKEGIESFSRALAELIVSRMYPNVGVDEM